MRRRFTEALGTDTLTDRREGQKNKPVVQYNMQYLGNTEEEHPPWMGRVLKHQGKLGREAWARSKWPQKHM